MLANAALLSLLSVALAGCLGAPAALPTQPAQQGQAAQPRVVVGLVDSGINPYHEQFQDPGAILPADFIDARTGRAPIPIHLTQHGTYEERVHADESVWRGVQPYTLYWFVGTRVLGVSVDKPSTQPLLLDHDSHGTFVASAVRNVSADAWIVAIQTNGDVLGRPNNEPVTGPVEEGAAGFAWLRDQPWVDVVSGSWGFFAPAPAVWEVGGFTQATRGIAERGKLFLQAAGNAPLPAWWEGTSGPPWAIAVGGVESSTRGDSPQAARGVDVVSDYSQRLALWNSTTGYEDTAGTSFSTPRAAGVLADALLGLRRQTGDVGGARNGVLCPCAGRNVTAGALRDALNESAEYWNTTDYRPLGYPSGDPVWKAYFTTLPVLPEPWVQMGWGYVGNGTARVVVDAVLGHPPPAKPEQAKAYQQALQQIREAYWSANPLARTTG